VRSARLMAVSSLAIVLAACTEFPTESTPRANLPPRFAHSTPEQLAEAWDWQFAQDTSYWEVAASSSGISETEAGNVLMRVTISSA
jgi:hypothetical protein